MRRAWLALVILAAARPAAASPSKGSIVIGPYGHGNVVEHVDLAVVTATNFNALTLTLTLGWDLPEPTDPLTLVFAPQLELALPAAANVVGMTAALDTHPAVTGGVEVGPEAWQRFCDHERARRDTALLDDRVVAHGRGLYTLYTPVRAIGTHLVVTLDIELSPSRMVELLVRAEQPGTTVTIDGTSSTITLAADYKPNRIRLPRPQRGSILPRTCSSIDRPVAPGR